ncbi:DNA-binding response regulator [Roseateles aquatilis]|uniref:DNA-binding response regulator n=1 Tax=Roseateles aquatilis TaxID=431061 RepID=A0A246JKG5_9BURK|nr:response regulator transcription factor [Roseateles aquatilis]OWQ93101.1 DNA-binding response regulator [Roseateles aquatilis]
MREVLLVEDDLPLGNALAKALEQAGYRTIWVRRVEDARGTLAARQVDAIVLDLGLPDGEGVTLLAELRQGGHGVPIVVATARGGLDDRLQALDRGADDYLVKPFAVPELLARLRAVLRRHAGYAVSQWSVGRVRIDTDQRRVWSGEEAVELTPREYQLLIELARRAGRWVPRDELFDRVYRDGESATMNALEVQVHGLRRKLGRDVVQTVRGVGYMMALE